MEARLRPLAAIFDLNTDLLGNCVLDLTDAQANQRLEGGGNSIAFLVAHMIDARHYLARMLGAPAPNPIGSLLADAGSIEDVKTMPTLSELLDAWREIGAHLARTFEELSPARLDAASPFDFPIPGGTAAEAAAFLAQHDSYHLGQISFLRRQLGLPAMTYDRPGPDGAD